VIQE
jgi:pimeloyl-ACP methyl ester carboxylesterase